VSGVGAQAAIPAGAETIDLGDATLLPGFPRCPTPHQLLCLGRLQQNLIDCPARKRCRRALELQPQTPAVTLMACFTTVRAWLQRLSPMSSCATHSPTVSCPGRDARYRAPLGSTAGHLTTAVAFVPASRKVDRSAWMCNQWSDQARSDERRAVRRAPCVLTTVWRRPND